MIKVVTCFNVNETEFPKLFLESFEKNWPAEVALEVWYHGGVLPEFPETRAVFHNLDEQPMWQEISARLKDQPDTKDYRFDLKRFTPKLYAIFSADLTDLDWLIWLDSDTETFAPIELKTLQGWLKGDVVFLDRPQMSNCESSFLAFNIKSEGTQRFVQSLAQVYHLGEVLNYKEFHDGFVITRLLRIFGFAGLRATSLTGNVEGLDAFGQSPLAQHMVHYKGPAKEGKPTIVSDPKYEILSEVVGTYRPRLLYFDTQDSNRIVQILAKAFESHDEIFINFKKRNAQTQKRLEGLKKIFERGKKFLHLEGVIEYDFAYYDGKAYFEDQGAKISIMEGYIPAVPGNEMIRGPSVRFDKDGDLMMSMGPFALRLAPDMPKFEPRRPMRVQPRNAVDPTFLIENVKVNTPKFKEWVPRLKPHGREAILISAGPTLEEQIPTIKQLMAEGPEKILFVVKHALPVLIKHGIEPHACVVLDARPLEGVSTHNEVRKSLYDNVSENTAFYIASMCAPETVDYLHTLGNKVLGWHAANEGMMNAGLKEFNTGLLVSGGTCAAWRQFAIAHVMGFRTFHLFGYDFYYREDQTSTNEIFEAFVGPNKKKFRTSGELIAALQDFEQIQRIVLEQGLMLYCYGDGMVAEVWKHGPELQSWDEFEQRD